MCDYFHVTMHDKKEEEKGCYIHTSIKECVDPRRTMTHPKAEFEIDELRFYLYISFFKN